MDVRLAEVLRLLELERLEVNIFRGDSRDIGAPQVFGGQVLGQALWAAYATVAGRAAHSLHAYFLRRGDFNAPIVYFVDRSRDGHSFSSRRVTAIQHGEQIFHMSASFQEPQAGVEHQIAMPAVADPQQLETALLPPRATLSQMPPKLREYYAHARPFEFRFVAPEDPVRPHKAPPMQQIWLRAVDRLPDDPVLHHCLLAYVSDYHLLSTATLPHAAPYLTANLVLASIDHAMWFHRPLRVDEWLLYATDSPSASGARGFSRGSLFTLAGDLVASTAQEGMLRVLEASGGEARHGEVAR
jgi:acyl-CoA thioesterase-2